MTYDPDEGDYRGRSLSYVRHLLDCPARWGSAKDAAEALREHVRADYPMVVGAVCFYEMDPWGDIGVYLGAGEVLRVVQGLPVLRKIYRDMDYIGWVSGQTFREASRSDEPVVS
jgi:hypothetical protein